MSTLFKSLAFATLFQPSTPWFISGSWCGTKVLSLRGSSLLLFAMSSSSMVSGLVSSLEVDNAALMEMFAMMDAERAAEFLANNKRFDGNTLKSQSFGLGESMKPRCSMYGLFTQNDTFTYICLHLLIELFC